MLVVGKHRPLVSTPPRLSRTLPCFPLFYAFLQSLGDAVIVCLHSEPDSPRVLPRGRVSPDSAEHPAAFLAALENPPMNPQSPSGRGKELSAAAEAAVAAARKKGTPGLVPYVPECLAGTLVEAFGVLAAADATDKRDRYECIGVVLPSWFFVASFVPCIPMQNTMERMKGTTANICEWGGRCSKVSVDCFQAITGGGFPPGRFPDRWRNAG